MKPKESFALRWQDLVIMSRDKSKITSVKTFDKQVGRVTKDGIIIKEEGLNAVDKKPYSMIRLWRFSEIFPKIKTITQRQNVEEKFKQKPVLIADRRYPNQKLMALGNGKYIRPKSSKAGGKKTMNSANEVKKPKPQKKKETKMEKSIINKKYQGLNVNRQIVRSLSSAQAVSVELENGQHGLLQGDYFVEELKEGKETFKKYTLIEECLSKISKIEWHDIVLANRAKNTEPLLTTGAGWELYYIWLPESYRTN